MLSGSASLSSTSFRGRRWCCREFDVAGCGSFGELVDAAGEGGGEVVVEASVVDVIDSSGLVALIAAKRRVEAAGGRLTVINPSPRVRRLLDLSGTVDVFDVAVTDG